MALVPYTFAGQSGQIPLAELDANFANVKAFAETAGNVTGNVQANITVLGTLTTLNVAGNITAPLFVGNVLGNVLGNISGNFTVPGNTGQLLYNNGGLANATSGIFYLVSNNMLAVGGNVNGQNLNANSEIFGNLIVSRTGEFGIGPNVTILSLANNRAETTWITGNASNVYIANANSYTRVQGNLTVGGTVSAAGNVLTGNIIISTNLSVTGNSILTGAATATTPANGTSNTQLATTAFVQNSLINALPSGVIVMWSGSIASIPTGWFLCNGANGTPDLRNRFIAGAGNSYAVGATGGSTDAIVVSHTHTATSSVTDPGHFHTYNGTSFIADYFGSGSNAASSVSNNTGSAVTGISVSTTVNSTGTSGSNANLPPYYALAYIMKA